MDQYILPFEAARNELLMQIKMLRRVDLGLSRGRAEGVIQILERLVLLGSDLTEDESNQVHVKAQGMAIAARIEGRKTVGERTVRNWRRDAEELQLLETDMHSQQYGGTGWNVYRIRVDSVRLWVGGSGRKRAEMIAAPRAETVAAPRAEKIAAPYHCQTSKVKQHSPLPDEFRVTPKRPPRPDLGIWDEVVVVLVEELKMSEAGAGGAIGRAKLRQLSPSDVMRLIERYRRDKPANPDWNIGWLHNWITGKRQPPPESKPKERPRMTREQAVNRARSGLLREGIDESRDWDDQRAIDEYVALMKLKAPQPAGADP